MLRATPGAPPGAQACAPDLSAQLAANRLGQSGLWPYAISGDLPIMLLRVAGDDLRSRANWSARTLRGAGMDWRLDLVHRIGRLDVPFFGQIAAPPQRCGNHGA